MILASLIALQITVTQAGIVAKAATQTCIITPTSAMCTCTRGDGSVFVCNVWTPMLVTGGDASGYNVFNGNAVNYSLAKRSDGSVWWFTSIRPNATGVLTQQGWTKFVVGPVAVGTLVNVNGKLVCQPQGTGAHVVPGVIKPPPDGTLVTPGYAAFNELQGNCTLP